MNALNFRILLCACALSVVGFGGCVGLLLYNPIAAAVLLALLIILAILAVVFSQKMKREIEKLLTGVRFEDSETRYTLSSFNSPTVVLSGKTIVWYNDSFQQEFCRKQPAVLQPINNVLPGFESAQLKEQKEPYRYCGENGVWLGLHSSTGKNGLSIVVLCSITDLDRIHTEYFLSRPVCMVLEVDAYDTIVSQLRESQRARLNEGISAILEQMADEYHGLLQKISSNRYLAVIEQRYLELLRSRKFDILDKVRHLDEDQGITLSIGIGSGAEQFLQSREWAYRALDMALGRGGDQAAIKNGDAYEFFGGVSKGVEKQSKVRSRIVSQALTETIKTSDSVLIMGHSFSDLDSLGAAYGILHMCRMCDIPSAIVFRRGATLAGQLAERIAAADNDCFMEPEDVLEAITPDTLLVVVDTCLTGRVESREVLERCSKIAVIDHHRKAVGAIENALVSYQEPYASSTCELVSEMLMYMGDKAVRPDVLTAQALLSGIMLDTRNFALHTGVRTFEAAAFLRRMGAQPESVKELLAASPAEYKAKSALSQNAELYRSCAISVMEHGQGFTSLAAAQAANDLMTIQGIKAAFVGFVKDGTVILSARSMGEINVQVILETMGGGGHLTMAGAQLHDCSREEAVQQIKKAVDGYFARPVDN